MLNSDPRSQQTGFDQIFPVNHTHKTNKTTMRIEQKEKQTEKQSILIKKQGRTILQEAIGTVIGF